MRKTSKKKEIEKKWSLTYFLAASVFLLLLVFFPLKKAEAIVPNEYCSYKNAVSGWLTNLKAQAVTNGFTLMSWTNGNYNAIAYPLGSTDPNIWKIFIGNETSLIDNNSGTYIINHDTQHTTWNEWQASTSDGGATWSIVQTLNATGGNSLGLTGNSTSTTCVVGLKQRSDTLQGGFSSDMYIYLPANPGTTWTGATFGDPPCPAGYTGSGEPNCTVVSTGGGGGTTDGLTLQQLKDYLTPRVKESMAIAIVAYASVVIISQFKWRAR